MPFMALKRKCGFSCIRNAESRALTNWISSWAAMLSLSLVGIFVTTGTLIQLASQRRLRNPLTWLRLAGWAISTGMEVLPTLALSALPSHHPSKLVDPSWFRLWLTDMETTTASDHADAR